MVACDFDMCFTFVSAGWEGSAHDARVFLHAIETPEMNFPKPPEGMTPTPIHIHVCTRARTCMYVCMHVCMYVCMHARTYMHENRHMHIHTQNYTL